MKTTKLGLLFLLFITIVLQSCKPQCIQNPEDDGKPPTGSIMIKYKDTNGSDISKIYNTGTSGTPNELFIPKGIPYNIYFTGQDSSCIKSITVERITLNNDNEKDQIADETSWLQQSFSCALRIQTISSSISTHDDNIIIYFLNVSDWFGDNNSNNLAVWVVPT